MSTPNGEFPGGTPEQKQPEKGHETPSSPSDGSRSSDDKDTTRATELADHLKEQQTQSKIAVDVGDGNAIPGVDLGTVLDVAEATEKIGRETELFDKIAEESGWRMHLDLAPGIIENHLYSKHQRHGALTREGRSELNANITGPDSSEVGDDVNESIIFTKRTRRKYKEVTKGHGPWKRTDQVVVKDNYLANHADFVIGGKDEPAVTIAYETRNDSDGLYESNHRVNGHGTRKTSLNFTMVLPESTAIELKHLLQEDPSVIHRLVDHMAVAQLGINQETWQSGLDEFDKDIPPRPPYEKWAEKNGGQNKIYMDLNDASENGTQQNLVVAFVDPFPVEQPEGSASTNGGTQPDEQRDQDPSGRDDGSDGEHEEVVQPNYAVLTDAFSGDLTTAALLDLAEEGDMQAIDNLRARVADKPTILAELDALQAKSEALQRAEDRQNYDVLDAAFKADPVTAALLDRAEDGDADAIAELRGRAEGNQTVLAAINGLVARQDRLAQLDPDNAPDRADGDQERGEGYPQGASDLLVAAINESIARLADADDRHYAGKAFIRYRTDYQSAGKPDREYIKPLRDFNTVLPSELLDVLPEQSDPGQSARYDQIHAVDAVTYASEDLRLAMKDARDKPPEELYLPNQERIFNEALGRANGFITPEAAIIARELLGLSPELTDEQRAKIGPLPREPKVTGEKRTVADAPLPDPEVPRAVPDGHRLRDTGDTADQTSAQPAPDDEIDGVRRATDAGDRPPLEDAPDNGDGSPPPEPPTPPDRGAEGEQGEKERLRPEAYYNGAVAALEESIARIANQESRNACEQTLENYRNRSTENNGNIGTLYSHDLPNSIVDQFPPTLIHEDMENEAASLRAASEPEQAAYLEENVEEFQKIFSDTDRRAEVDKVKAAMALARGGVGSLTEEQVTANEAIFNEIAPGYNADRPADYHQELRILLGIPERPATDEATPSGPPPPDRRGGPPPPDGREEGERLRPEGRYVPVVAMIEACVETAINPDAQQKYTEYRNGTISRADLGDYLDFWQDRDIVTDNFPTNVESPQEGSDSIEAREFKQDLDNPDNQELFEEVKQAVHETRIAMLTNQPLDPETYAKHEALFDRIKVQSDRPTEHPSNNFFRVQLGLRPTRKGYYDEQVYESAFPLGTRPLSSREIRQREEVLIGSSNETDFTVPPVPAGYEDVARRIAEGSPTPPDGSAPGSTEAAAGREREQLSGTSMSGATEAHEGHPDRNEDSLELIPERNTLILADGMAGHADGRLASSLATSHTAESVRSRPTSQSVEDTARDMKEAIIAADKHLLAEATRLNGGRQPEGRGLMGTTLTMGTVIEDASGKRTAVIGNVGDSRAYILRDGKLDCLTVDDSLENSQGTLDERRERQKQWSERDEAAPATLYQALGTGNVDPTIYTYELQKGDILILTGDGIHDNLKDSEIQAILNENSDPAVASKKLVQEAQRVSRLGTARSKRDDMTAGVMETDAQLAATDGNEAKKPDAKETNKEPLDLSAINLTDSSSDAAWIMHHYDAGSQTYTSEQKILLHALSSGDVTGIDTLLSRADEPIRDTLERVKATLIAREERIAPYKEVIEGALNDKQVIHLEESWAGGQEVRGFDANDADVQKSKRQQLLRLRGSNYLITNIIAQDKGVDAQSTSPRELFTDDKEGKAIELQAGDPNEPHEYRYFVLGALKQNGNSRPFVGYYLQIPTANTALLQAVEDNPSILFDIYRKKFDTADVLPPALHVNEQLSTVNISDLLSHNRAILPDAFQKSRKDSSTPPAAPEKRETRTTLPEGHYSAAIGHLRALMEALPNDAKIPGRYSTPQEYAKISFDARYSRGADTKDQLRTLFPDTNADELDVILAHLPDTVSLSANKNEFYAFKRDLNGLSANGGYEQRRITEATEDVREAITESRKLDPSTKALHEALYGELQIDQNDQVWDDFNRIQLGLAPVMRDEWDQAKYDTHFGPESVPMTWSDFMKLDLSQGGSPESAEQGEQRGVRLGGETQPNPEHPHVNQDTMFVNQKHEVMGVFAGIGDDTEDEANIARGITANRYEKQEDPITSIEAAEAFIEDAFRYASGSLDGDKSFATTGTVVQLVTNPEGERTAVIGYKGNDKVYVYNNGKIKSLIEDNGLSIHNDGNPSSPELVSYNVQANDVLIAVTDGVYKNLSERAIAQILSEDTDATEASRKLVERAKAAGTFKDNMTATVMETSASLPAQAAPESTTPSPPDEQDDGKSRKSRRPKWLGGRGSASDAEQDDDSTQTAITTPGAKPLRPPTTPLTPQSGPTRPGAKPLPGQRPAAASEATPGATADGGSTTTESTAAVATGSTSTEGGGTSPLSHEQQTDAPQVPDEVKDRIGQLFADSKTDLANRGLNESETLSADSFSSLIEENFVDLHDLNEAAQENNGQALSDMLNQILEQRQAQIRRWREEDTTADTPHAAVDYSDLEAAISTLQEIQSTLADNQITPTTEGPELHGVEGIYDSEAVARYITDKLIDAQEAVESLERNQNFAFGSGEFRDQQGEIISDDQLFNMFEATDYDATKFAQELAKQHITRRTPLDLAKDEVARLEEGLSQQKSLEERVQFMKDELQQERDGLEDELSLSRNRKDRKALEEDIMTLKELQAAFLPEDALLHADSLRSSNKTRFNRLKALLKRGRAENSGGFNHIGNSDQESHIVSETTAAKIQGRFNESVQELAEKIWSNSKTGEAHPDMQDPVKKASLLARGRLLATVLHYQSRTKKALVIGGAVYAGFIAYRMGAFDGVSDAVATIGDAFGGDNSDLGIPDVEIPELEKPDAPPHTPTTSAPPVEPSPSGQAEPPASSGENEPTNTNVPPMENGDPRLEDGNMLDFDRYPVVIELSHVSESGQTDTLIDIPKESLENPDQLKEIIDTTGRNYSVEANIPFGEARAEIAEKVEQGLERGNVHVSIPPLEKVEAIPAVRPGMISYSIDLAGTPAGSEYDRIEISFDHDDTPAERTSMLNGFAEAYAEETGLPQDQIKNEVQTALEARGIEFGPDIAATTEPPATSAPATPAPGESGGSPGSEVEEPDPTTTNPPTGAPTTSEPPVTSAPQTSDPAEPPAAPRTTESAEPPADPGTTTGGAAPSGQPDAGGPGSPAGEPNEGGAGSPDGDNNANENNQDQGQADSGDQEQPSGQQPEQPAPPQADILTHDELRQDIDSTFADFGDFQVEPNDGYQKVFAEYFNEQNPGHWVNDNETSQGAVFADILRRFAEQNGTELPPLHPGNAPDISSVIEGLSDDQLQILHDVTETGTAQDYFNNVQDRFHAVLEGTPLSELDAQVEVNDPGTGNETPTDTGDQEPQPTLGDSERSVEISGPNGQTLEITLPEGATVDSPAFEQIIQTQADTLANNASIPRSIAEYIVRDGIESSLQSQGLDIEIPNPPFDTATLLTEIQQNPEFNAILGPDASFTYEGGALWNSVAEHVAPLDELRGWQNIEGYTSLKNVITDMLIDNALANGLNLNELTPGQTYTFTDLGINMEQVAPHVAGAFAENSGAGYAEHGMLPYMQDKRTW